MLLAIDIGNTTISFGVLHGQRTKQVYTIDSEASQAHIRNEINKILGRIKRKYPTVSDAVLCSVVPKVLKIIERSVNHQLKVKPRVIGRDIKVPIKNKYCHPKQVGQDRLVGAYAAREIYGRPAIIIDFGTAITFDVVSKQGAYEGGIIVPGIRLSAESLHKKTALLPKVSTIKGPRTLIGRDTKESILSGIFYGYGSLCHGLIDHITKQIKGRPKIIVTGGHTRLMKKYIANKITKIDKDLVFKGMALLANISPNS